jgi:4-hydroxy-3-methylbut-2-enyl diphosphate reductase
VDEVVDVLQQHGNRPGKLKELFAEPLLTPILISLGMAAMTLGIHAWMGLTRSWASVLIVFTYALSMFLATPFLDPFGLGAKGPARARYLERHKKLMLSLAALALLTSLVLGLHLGFIYATIVAIASVLGLSYKLRIGLFGKTISLRAIPGSKDVLITLGLVIMGFVLPTWQQKHLWEWRSLNALALVAALVFARSILVSLADMQRDQILGRETLPILIGRARSQLLMYVLLALAWCTNVAQAIQTGNMGVFVVLTLCVIYPILYQWFFKTKFSAERPRIDPGPEPAFFLAGLMAFMR